MKQLKGKIFLVTGATGGIGKAIAQRLLVQGARLIVVGRSREKLHALESALHISARGGFSIPADITTHEGREMIRSALDSLSQPLDGLINCAGVTAFGMLADSRAADIEALIATNIMAPILLTRMVLPYLNKNQARLINVGSSFGALGFPGFSAYCASKFALRGFSEALRRELSDTTIQVAYLAPRATNTELNTDAVSAMNRELGNRVDQPERVARKVEKMLLMKRMSDSSIGWPERFFLWINSIFPRSVDLALSKQLPVIRRYAKVETC
jgi:short-subunit dehydrogenase